MVCTLFELQNKEVINLIDGTRLGFVDDIELDTEKSEVLSLIVYGRPRFFGIFGREDDIVIRCEEIELIGEDAILVNMEKNNLYSKARRFSFQNAEK